MKLFITKKQEAIYQRLKANPSKELATAYDKEFHQFMDWDLYPQVDSGEKDLFEFRKNLVRFLEQRDMFCTIILFTKIQIQVLKEYEALASIGMHLSSIRMTLREDFFRLGRSDQIAVVLHEINHVYQLPLVTQMIGKLTAGLKRKEIKKRLDLINKAMDLVVNREVLKLNSSIMSSHVKNQICILNNEKEQLKPNKKSTDCIPIIRWKDGLVEEFCPASITKEKTYQFDEGLSWIQYYDLLLQEQKDKEGNGEGEGEGDGENGDDEGEGDYELGDGEGDVDFDSLSEEQVEKILEDIADSNRLGEQLAKKAGKIPSDTQKNIVPNISKRVKELLKRVKLIGSAQRSYVEETYSRRCLALPDCEEVCGELRLPIANRCIVILDTSGSMEYNKVIEEAVGGLSMLINQKVIESAWGLDCNLHKIEVNKGSTKTFKVEGFGGTSILPKHIEEIEAQREEKNGVTTYIYITDGEVDLEPIQAYFKKSKSILKVIELK